MDKQISNHKRRQQNMKVFYIAAALMCFTLTGMAQTSETKYYRRLPPVEEVPKEKAKYSRTITTNPDSTVAIEQMNLKSNVIEHRQVHKGEEPVGRWIYLTGRGQADLNYDFKLVYSDEDCPSTLPVKNLFYDEPGLGYEAPKISPGVQFHEYLWKNLVYPATARRGGIQGKVDLIFDLTKEGTIENIRVKKGAHVVLDKEAVRILRKIKLSSPPKIKGQPENLCGIVSISFRLES
jgi:TonB family protein